MSELIAALVGGCVVGLIVAFVLVARKYHGLTLALADARLERAAANAEARTQAQNASAAYADRDRAVEQRDFAMEQGRLDRAAIVDLTNRLANVARAKNPLYQEAIENVQSHNVQAALLLLNSKRDLEDALTLLNRDKKGKAK